MWQGATQRLAGSRCKVLALLQAAKGVDTNNDGGSKRYKALVDKAQNAAKGLGSKVVQQIAEAAFLKCPRTGRWQSNTPSHHRQALEQLICRFEPQANTKTTLGGGQHFSCDGSGFQKAERLAKQLLDDCVANGRAVNDADVLRWLESFPMKKNFSRKNVLRQGQEYVFSTTLGLVALRSGGFAASSAAKSCPSGLRLLSCWLIGHCSTKYNKPFPFTGVCVNRGFAAALHRDARNSGPSLLRALGQVKHGGCLRYYPGDDGKLPLDQLPGNGSVCCFNPMKTWVLMDGTRALAVGDFEGIRYSLVFYSSSGFENASDPDKEYLTSCGMTWPTSESLAFFSGYEAALRSVIMATPMLLQMY